MMAQMLSTFSNIEQSRFQAYRRVTFRSDAIEDWVASCLQHRYDTATSNAIMSSTNNTAAEVATSVRCNPYYNNILLNAQSGQHQLQQQEGPYTTQPAFNSTNDRRKMKMNRTYRRPLSDLVAPGQHADIGLVVTIAAKIYAQRLVKAALAYQKDEQQKQQNRKQQEDDASKSSTQQPPNDSNINTGSSSNGNSNTNNASTNNSIPTNPAALQALSIWKVVVERQKRGIDPGFFLHSSADDNVGYNNISASASEQSSYHEQKRLAALAAQEEYDTWLKKVQEHEQQEEEEEKKQQEMSDKIDKNSDDDMDSDSGDDDEIDMDMEETEGVEGEVQPIADDVPTDNNDMPDVQGSDNGPDIERKSSIAEKTCDNVESTPAETSKKETDEKVDDSKVLSDNDDIKETTPGDNKEDVDGSPQKQNSGTKEKEVEPKTIVEKKDEDAVAAGDVPVEKLDEVNIMEDDFLDDAFGNDDNDGDNDDDFDFNM